MLAAKDYIRSQFGQLDVHELVGRPVSTLQGVTKAVEAALNDIGISTVFDLGASWIFANARAAAAAATDGTASARFGMAPTDWLQGDHTGTTLDQIGALPVEALRGLTDAQGKALAAALDVHNIRDFAYWPPQVAAQNLVGQVAGGSLTVDLQEIEDTEALRPKFGDFPTERVYYRTLTMLEMPPPVSPGDIIRSPLSLLRAIEHEKAPSAPAIGAMLVYSQSWYAKGITLGHMLHSLALAPGEATRIAVVDWSRRSRASDAETVGEQESLDNAMNHARATSEVQSAVAKELERGGSQTHAHSHSDSSSTQGAASTGILGEIGLGFSADVSGTTQDATTTTDASSTSYSMGDRSILASMNQNVNDRTEQHATSVRNRRASAVSEVGDAGHDQVSTRIVANYNHMHALTVQYYETVQVYRVLTQLHSAERCLFVPIALLDFSGAHGMELVEHFRGSLMRAALNRRATELLADQTTAVAVIPATPIQVPTLRPRLPVHRLPAPSPLLKLPTNIFGALEGSLHAALAHPHVERATVNALQSALHTLTGQHSAGHALVFGPFEAAFHAAQAHPHAEKTGLAAINSAFGAVKSIFGSSAAHPPAPVRPRPVFHPFDIRHAASIVGRPIVRPGSHNLYFPQDTEVHGLSFEGVHARSATITTITGGHTSFPVVDEGSEIDLHPAPKLSELAAISVIKADNPAVAGKMTLQLANLGRYFASPAIDVSFPAGTAAHQVVSFKSEAEDRKHELLAHLQANRTHYSHAVFKALDPATIVTMLSQYSWNGRPLADQVEPRPLAITGNYLVLRAPVELEESAGTQDGFTWAQLLHSRGVDFTSANPRLIPIPTSGVFAEAVLGRSNSAEKLDITRFWHWQDSPIPLPPTEISPVSTKLPDNTLRAKPGALEAPVVAMMAPTALPDPTSLAATLTAVSKGDLFRDMSGLAGTQALAKEGMQQTLKGTTEAAKIASANMATEAQKAVDMAKIGADVFKTALSALADVNQAKSASKEGAEINQAEDQDNRGVPGKDGSTGESAKEREAVNKNRTGSAGLGPNTILASLTDGSDVPASLTAPLTASEWKQIDLWMAAGSVNGTDLTGEPQPNATIIASALFCVRRKVLGGSSDDDPQLCVDPDVTAADPRVKALIGEVNKHGPIIYWARVPLNTRMGAVMDRLISVYGYTVNGSAGLVGNLRAESLVLPDRIEGSSAKEPIHPMRAQDFAKVWTNWTADQVMNRNLNKKIGPLLAGIGIAQWTSSDRRGPLFKRTAADGRALGSSILFDMAAQIQFLVHELETTKRFQPVNMGLLDPDITVDDASDLVLNTFEHPGSLSDPVKKVKTTNDRRGFSHDALAAYQNAPAGATSTGDQSTDTPPIPTTEA